MSTSHDVRLDELARAIAALETKLATAAPPTPPDLSVANDVHNLGQRIAALETTLSGRDADREALAESVGKEAANTLRAMVKAEVAKSLESTHSAVGTILKQLREEIQEEVRQAVAGVVGTAQLAAAGSTASAEAARTLIRNFGDTYARRARGAVVGLRQQCREAIDTTKRDLSHAPIELQLSTLSRSAEGRVKLLEMGHPSSAQLPIKQRVGNAAAKANEVFSRVERAVHDRMDVGHKAVALLKDLAANKPVERPEGQSSAQLYGVYHACLTLQAARVLPDFSVSIASLCDDLEAGIARGNRELSEMLDDIKRYRSTEHVARLGAQLDLWAQLATSDDVVVRAEAVAQGKGVGQRFRAAREKHAAIYGKREEG